MSSSQRERVVAWTGVLLTAGVVAYRPGMCPARGEPDGEPVFSSVQCAGGRDAAVTWFSAADRATGGRSDHLALHVATVDGAGVAIERRVSMRAVVDDFRQESCRVVLADAGGGQFAL